MGHLFYGYFMEKLQKYYEFNFFFFFDSEKEIIAPFRKYMKRI